MTTYILFNPGTTVNAGQTATSMEVNCAGYRLKTIYFRATQNGTVYIDAFLTTANGYVTLDSRSYTANTVFVYDLELGVRRIRIRYTNSGSQTATIDIGEVVLIRY